MHRGASLAKGKAGGGDGLGGERERYEIFLSGLPLHPSYDS